MLYLKNNTHFFTRLFAMGPTQKIDINNFNYFIPIQSRWNDNDHQGHINNAVYYEYMDLVINDYLNLYCNFKGSRFMVFTSFSYYNPIKYPESFVGALMVDKIGKSSVQYTFGLFKTVQCSFNFETKEQNLKEKFTKLGLHGFLKQEDNSVSDLILKHYQHYPVAIGKAVHVFIDDKSDKPVTEIPTHLRKGLAMITNEAIFNSSSSII